MPKTTREYQYCYAIISPEFGDMCVQVDDGTEEVSNPNYIPIPEYNEEYIMKYYSRDNGKWYTDAAHTQEWIPA